MSTQITSRHSLKPIQRLIQATAMGLFAGIISALPAKSADTLYFDYGIFGRTLSVSSLETFAQEGTVDDELAPFFNAIPSDKQQQFQQVLTTPIEQLNLNIPLEFIDPFVLSQWLYTPMGESVLVRAGELIQTAGRLNGQQAIRGAILIAAADPDGLSLLNIIRAYPTEGIRFNLLNILKLINAVDTNREITETLMTAIAQSSATAAASEPNMNYEGLPVLAQTGEFAVEQRSLVLNDPERDRTFPVEIFLPANLDAVQGSIPVMILSHGYGATRTDSPVIQIAQTMAANGYIAVLPEHVGSNKQYKRDLIRGLNQDSFEAMEFINRPLDIRFLIDTLEQQNTTIFEGRLQLDRVGVLGHSFGGYTALAAAGATVDIEYLEAQCALDNDITHEQVNIALALQCRALELKSSPDVLERLTDGSLTDDRIGFVFTLFPIASLFGKGGMSNVQVPTVILGGSLDIASPVAVEQVAAFQGLTTDQKYLYLAENLSHTAELTRVALEITNPNTDMVESFSKTREQFTDLIITLAIAYGNVHLQNDDSYLPYLTSAYVEAVSIEPVNFHLVRAIESERQND